MAATGSFTVPRAAALLTWLTVGVPIVGAAAGRARAPALIELGGWLAFGALFACARRGGLGRRAGLLLLLAQTLAAAAVAYAGERHGLEVALLVMVAVQLAPATAFDRLDQPDPLTPREAEVLHLIAAGYSNKEIAEALGTAEDTVKNHASSILSKLGVRDRTRAVLRALELGWV